MRRLARTLKREHNRPLSEQGQKSLSDYDAVLFDWNDSINRNLGLLERYFGTDRRDDLDYKIGALMGSVGAALESQVRLENTREEDLGVLQSDLDRLANLIYAYNVELIRSIQEGRVGPS
jgi:hypothetical protein